VPRDRAVVAVVVQNGQAVTSRGGWQEPMASASTASYHSCCRSGSPSRRTRPEVSSRWINGFLFSARCRRSASLDRSPVLGPLEVPGDTRRAFLLFRVELQGQVDRFLLGFHPG
jgi:hypothetical protein